LVRSERADGVPPDHVPTGTASVGLEADIGGLSLKVAVAGDVDASGSPLLKRL
jgi:hypothetical protein